MRHTIKDIALKKGLINPPSVSQHTADFLFYNFLTGQAVPGNKHHGDEIRK